MTDGHKSNVVLELSMLFQCDQNMHLKIQKLLNTLSSKIQDKLKMKRGLLLKLCLSIVIFIFSVQYAMSLEGKSIMEKKVTVTNLYPDIPQYTGDYFFVGSYEQETGMRTVIARTLLKFNTNQFKGMKISKAELVLKSKNLNERALAYAGKPLTLGIYKMASGDWVKASWNNIFAEDYEFSGKQLQINGDG